MADILDFQSADQLFYRDFVREHIPDRRTQGIIADLKMLPMTGEDAAVMRGVLFAELAVKSERVAG